MPNELKGNYILTIDSLGQLSFVGPFPTFKAAIDWGNYWEEATGLSSWQYLENPIISLRKP